MASYDRVQSFVSNFYTYMNYVTKRFYWLIPQLVEVVHRNALYCIFQNLRWL